MVVGCPKCKAKLKIADEKIKPEGTKIKCPKCQAVLLVKRPVKKAAPPPPPPAAEAPAPPTEKEPWPEMPSEAPAEEEPWPEMPPEAPAEQEPWPEIPPDELEPPAPEAPAPPFEEPAAPPAMEPVMEAPAPPEALAGGQKVLLAHSNPETVNMLKFVLSGANFSVTSASDGVAAMIKTMKELPEVVVADVRLPKIHGVEVMKRLRTKNETKDVKVILTGTKPESEVTALHGAAGYIHQDRMQQGLVEMINNALAAKKEEPAAAAPPQPAAAPKPTQPPSIAKSSGDPGVDRAQRLSRTVMADIDLYNKEQVAQAIQQGTFESTFAKELKEGLKLYEMRISADVRSKGDFYNDALKTFIEKKKDQLGLS